MILHSNIYGHSNEKHASDMWKVFPFVNCPQNIKIQKFYYLMNAYIDYKTFPSAEHCVGTPQCIVDNFPRCKFDNHRIWFHWGFNTDPKLFTPLVELVRSNILKGNMKESELDKFWYILEQERRKRNKYLMDQWSRISGYIGLTSLMHYQRKQSNAFVTLLYSIHILGDHQTSCTSIMANKTMIYGDIYNALDNLAGKSSGNYTKAKLLKNKLKLAQSDPSRFLYILEKEFTPFIYSLNGIGYDYKLRFQRLGYILK